MSPYEITLATAADVAEITALLQANSASRGGSLTGEFPPEQVMKLVPGPAPVVAARREGHLAGALFSSAKDDPAAPAVVRAMLAAWPGTADAYVYGPVCIAAAERGRGLLRLLYAALRHYYPGREAVLFIRQDNIASLRAHQRLGMRTVSRFAVAGVDYWVLSDRRA